jgi:hypothetical protein
MVEESQNGGRASCDAGPVGNRKRAKLRSHQKCENKSNVRKNATGQILVARWIKLPSPSRHVENVALHLANAGARSVSATAAAASGVSGSSIRENAKLGNAGRAEEIRKRSIVAGLDPDPRAQAERMQNIGARPWLMTVCWRQPRSGHPLRPLRHLHATLEYFPKIT